MKYKLAGIVGISVTCALSIAEIHEENARTKGAVIHSQSELSRGLCL